MTPRGPARNARIAVISDTHANILALEAAIRDINLAGVDSIIHLGDVIGFGPRPAECLDLILATPSIIPLMGNHDSWCLKGDAGPGKPPGVIDHLEWTWARVNQAHRSAMAKWPFRIEKEYGGFHAAFQHYALDSSGEDFQEIEGPPSPELYENKFATAGIDAVFFGHDHSASDTAGTCRFIDPGTLGTGPEPVARWLLVTFPDGGMKVKPRMAPYDRIPLWRDFDELNVPGRAEILDRFYAWVYR